MGKKINEELLRQRAEHNDGELSTLKEITLHQFDLEKIENLDVYCRHLQILFLQNNLIPKLENLNKLKELSYLNMAINNVTKLEGLEGCESLSKLDLTLNFIEDPLDVESLAKNELLRELYLVGNPCSQQPGYREFVITALPQLISLDGREIERSERIQARQVFDGIRARFIEDREKRLNAVEETPVVVVEPEALEDLGDLSKEEILEKKKQEFQKKPVPYTPAARVEAARDIEQFNEKEPPKPDPLRPIKAPLKLFTDDGTPLQKNQGKWNFHVSNTNQTLALHLELPKLMDTSLIDVDVHSTYVTVTVKGKVFQLVLDEEVESEGVLCERSRLTGELVITMIKAGHKDVDVRRIRVLDEGKISKSAEPVKKLSRYQEMVTGAAVDYRNIVSEAAVKPSKPIQQHSASKIVERKGAIAQAAEPDFEDDPDVPPLY
ncbi:hypothetical protein SmJEL517_g02019 [Synchytrium microbalum]|uniref:U2A'/phosphoprotein 32 family A C-terminal domain-containing protein n=1 Tax=Synchytrium microbalum TaxID=1806994 RepID=A0A507CDQ4_9FUNG|nr:uncharacterized protein SmJEL517_g02019 [Synchytrium microbalum]TPX35695.1 hypothetical protein SmJEL517_g02019 [Synchytrium microbalum]